MWTRESSIVAISMMVTMQAHAAPKSITAIEGTVKIKAAPRLDSEPVGLFRAGQTLALRAADPVGHGGCTRGWYAVEPRGFVCASDRTSWDPAHPRAQAATAVLPADRGYPYQYARVVAPTPRRLRLDEALEGDDPLSVHFSRTDGPRKDPMNAYVGMKIPWARELVVDGQLHVVTPDLHLIRKDHIENATWVLKRSAWLTATSNSPFAMTLRDTRAHDAAGLPSASMQWPMTALVPLASGRHRAGVVRKTTAGRRSVRALEGGWIPQAHVSVFAPRVRPAGIGEHEKWVHVRINDGSLIAYVGDTPIWGAVISPGMHGANANKPYSTPTGRFRISTKHLTSDMGGQIGQGAWRSRAVPWVAYFQGAYALHGAWWHDVFGQPRSHGCINLTPGDARTLFRWLEPSVPRGWYAVRATAEHRGTVVVISP